jgi:hypothetical protein
MLLEKEGNPFFFSFWLVKGLVQLENRIPEARIGDFPGHPAPAAERPQRRLFEREARVSSLQRSEEAQGRKMSSARRDLDFQRPLARHSGESRD